MSARSLSTLCAPPRGGPKGGCYGLDLYSLYPAIEAVIAYLDRADPEAARQARAAYGCFERFGDDSQEYGWSTGFGLSESCEHEALQQLVTLQQRATDYLARDGQTGEDDFFYAEQNARLVR